MKTVIFKLHFAIVTVSYVIFLPSYYLSFVSTYLCILSINIVLNVYSVYNST